EIPDQLLLLRVHRDHRLAAPEELEHAIVDVLELQIAIGMGRTLVRLTIGLEAVFQLLEQSRHGPGADAMTLELQLAGQISRTLTGPAQGGFRVPSGHGIDQFLQVADQVGIARSERLSPATWPSNPMTSRCRAEGVLRRRLEFPNPASDRGQG